MEITFANSVLCVLTMGCDTFKIQGQGYTETYQETSINAFSYLNS